jgi:UvrD-like helicase C-terminal domain/PhoH-like protein
MAAVVANAVAARRGRIEDGFVVRVGLQRALVEREEVDALVAEQVARGVPYRVGRAALRTRLVNLVHRRMGQLDSDPRDVIRKLRADPALRGALDAVGPAVSPQALVRDLLSDTERLAMLADGILDPDEQVVLARTGQAPWTVSDLALVDEARSWLEGHTATYGHVIVDEAQDLSPMQLRMIARRAPGGSVTVLGDLAQATAAWHTSRGPTWPAHLATPDGWSTRDLTLGYRVPGQVLDYASRLLSEAAPQVPLTESVRRGRHAPRVIVVAPDDLMSVAAQEVEALSREGFWIGCIVAREHEAPAIDAFTRRKVVFGTPERDGILKQITLLRAASAKGLEFEAVVVVEPAAIAGHDGRGLRLLYVALTRPTRHLSVLHARPLPRALVRQTLTSGNVRSITVPGPRSSAASTGSPP